MEKKGISSQIFKIANNMGAWLIILLVGIVLTAATDTFLTYDNIINVLRQSCVVAITAMGASFVVLGGEIDLSTGMAATFAGCNTALLMTKMNMPIFPAILISVFVGCICGTAEGLIVTYLKIPSFMGTLGI